MKLNFNDSSITLEYIQKFLHDTYNDDIKISGNYYTWYNIKYGFAHYVAKYLDTFYPVLDNSARLEYEEQADLSKTSSPDIRPITKTISLKNYFLSDNKGNKLTYNPDIKLLKLNEENKTSSAQTEFDLMYEQIYNEYMRCFRDTDEQTGFPVWKVLRPSAFNYFDLPLFTQINNNGNPEYKNDIFTLQPWDIEKGVCEIDNFVASYLLGRTITPNSTRDEIYYAQKLIYDGRQLLESEKGVWTPYPNDPNNYMNLTNAIVAFQKARVNVHSDSPLFVTGYFDIFTEKLALSEYTGSDEDGIYGL